MANKDIALKWLEQVDEDISAAECLLQGGHWLYVAFLCHQAIEKTIKAYWLSSREDDPPYIHDHYKLLERCGLASKLNADQERFLELMSPMYIAARYPEHKRRVAQMLNDNGCRHIIEETKKIRQWILQQY